ncbi:hypothetical protein LIS04_179 [Listeria phage LIS04]|nr:hypothetical protein LIS04_179 [Listeria phage LIS04]
MSAVDSLVKIVRGQYLGLSGVIIDKICKDNGSHEYLVRVDLPNGEFKLVTLRASKFVIINIIPSGTKVRATYQLTEDTVSVTSFVTESDMTEDEIKRITLQRVNSAPLPEGILIKKQYEHWTQGVSYTVIPKYV